jgi:hypothetical protein
MRATRGIAASVVLTLGGCATSFTGSAHFPGGASGCFEHCKKQGMEMGAFVYAGSYSDACVCEPVQDGTKSGRGAGAAFGPAAVGVVLQARAAQQQQQAGRRY